LGGVLSSLGCDPIGVLHLINIDYDYQYIYGDPPCQVIFFCFSVIPEKAGMTILTWLWREGKDRVSRLPFCDKIEGLSPVHED
jgi:hypothetical protein